MKIAKNMSISLKEKNSSRFNHRDSDSFSFLTLHDHIFLTHFPEGRFNDKLILEEGYYYPVKNGLFSSMPELK
jgi:hypothetical protein